MGLGVSTLRCGPELVAADIGKPAAIGRETLQGRKPAGKPRIHPQEFLPPKCELDDATADFGQDLQVNQAGIESQRLPAPVHGIAGNGLACDRFDQLDLTRVEGRAIRRRMS